MNFDYLIRVYRYYSDNKDRVKVGAAYPVAPSFILTARHVLADKGFDIDLAQIEITWFYKYNQDGKKYRSDPCSFNICWDGSKDSGDGHYWDAVILKCNFPNDISVKPTVLSQTVPTALKCWESRGFPAIGERNEDLTPTSLQGETFACHKEDKIFQVTATAKGKDAKGWRGASGAPVFVDNKIQGLLIESCESTEGARIDALPMHKLLGFPSFRKAIGFPNLLVNIAPERFKERIINVLKHNSNVLDLLGRIAKDNKFIGKPISMCEGMSDKAVYIVDHMFQEFDCGKDLIELALNECEILNLREEEFVLLQIVYLYFPACFAREESEFILEEYESKVSLLDSRAASSASIEFRMAAIEGRAANFDLDQTGQDGLVGRKKIHDPPAFPLEADWNTEFKKAFAKMLFEKSTSSVRYKVKNYLSEKILNTINDKLKIGRGKQGVPYLVLGDPDDKHNKNLTDEKCQQTAKNIKNLFSNLAIFSVSEDDEVIDREVDYLDWFWEKCSKR